MIRKESRFWTVTTRLVMTLLLVVGYGTSAWGQVKSYLMSKDNLGSVYVSSDISWDDSKGGMKFNGADRSGGNKNVVKITDNPFENVNPATGFALTMQCWINSSQNNGNRRLFEVFKNNNGTRYHWFNLIGGMSNTTDNWHMGIEMQRFYGASNNVVTYVKKSDTSKTYADKWVNVAVIFRPKDNSTAIAEVYVDGVMISTATHNGIYQTLYNIKDYDNVWIGNCNVDNHGTNGWIRNVQIIPSGNVNSLYLRSGVESLLNGKITAKVTGSSSGQAVTKAGIIMSSGVDIVLTAEPNTGYYMSEMFLDQTTGATTSVMTKSASDAYTNPEYSFTFNNTSYTFATFAQREYTVVYDQNSDVTVGGNTTTETVTGMPTATSTKYKYFTDAFTFPSATPTRTGYTFLGWSTDKNATTATYTANQTIEADNTSTATTPKGILSSAVSDDHVLTLYAIWQKNDYTLNINVITQDYTGTQTASNSGTNSVTGTGGTVALARALETTPDEWTATNTVVQYKDRVKITTTNATDYHLQELRYSYNDGTEHTVDITDWNGYANVVKDFTMNHAAVTTVTAVFRHDHQYTITSDIQQNDGAGNSVAYLVTHNSTEGEPIASTASPTAMENDLVKVQATIASGYKLRQVDYKFTEENDWHSLYNNKTSGTGSLATFTTDALTMLGKDVAVKTVFLADRTVSVGGHSERGSITMTGTYGTSSGGVTTDATSANASLTANLGDLVTVAATCATNQCICF